MIEHALAILGTHLIWQLQIVAMEARDAGAIEESTLDSISARRRSLLEKTEEFAVGNESNACDGVKEVVSHNSISCLAASRVLNTSSLARRLSQFF